MIALCGILLRVFVLSVALILQTDLARSELCCTLTFILGFIASDLVVIPNVSSTSLPLASSVGTVTSQPNQTRSKAEENPDRITVCSAKDPEVNSCLLKTAMDIVNTMKTGIPELGVPVLDPFFVPMSEIGQMKMNLNLSFINMSIYGLDEAIFTRANAEPENYTMEFEYVLPKQIFLSTYRVDGKILMLPITGQGNSNITMVNVKIICKINGESHTRDGINYMKIKKAKLSIEPELVKIQLDNLFNGNEMLGNIMNDVLNSNWKDVYESVRPTFEKQYGNALFEVVQSIFHHTPYDRIFQDLK